MPQYQVLIWTIRQNNTKTKKMTYVNVNGELCETWVISETYYFNAEAYEKQKVHWKRLVGHFEIFLCYSKVVQAMKQLKIDSLNEKRYRYGPNWVSYRYGGSIIHYQIERI